MRVSKAIRNSKPKRGGRVKICLEKEQNEIIHNFLNEFFMRVHLKTKSRNQMIGLGERIGGFIKESRQDRPWFITLDGDRDSGKSLIALAIDKAFRPNEYPNGILSKSRHVADNLIKGPIIFRNMRNQFYIDKQEFDEGLRKFGQENEKSVVHIASNLNRFFMKTFNHAADGLDSDILDIKIKVTRGRGPVRIITIVARDENLAAMLAQSPLAMKKANLQFSAPLPPA